VSAARHDHDGVERDERERTEDRRMWAAIQLALDVDVCGSILRRRPVRAGDLDGVQLRRALRGARLPDPEDYILIDADMLDAIAEAGLKAPR
jgi:hypothetical protein